jgi:hypothetical protein
MKIITENNNIKGTEVTQALQFLFDHIQANFDTLGLNPFSVVKLYTGSKAYRNSDFNVYSDFFFQKLNEMKE